VKSIIVHKANHQDKHEDKIRVVSTKRGGFSSFPPFFRISGAGVAGSPGSITSAIFIPLLITIPPPPAPGKFTIRSHVE